MTAADRTHEYRRTLALARARSEAGAWDEAARLWATVVERNPFHGGHWRALAEARERSGDRAAALTAHARTLEQTSWPMDHRTWVAPDIAVPPTFEACRRNEDPALDAILAWREELPGG